MPPRNRRWKPLPSAYPDPFSSSHNDQGFSATDSRFASAPTQVPPPRPTGPPYVPTLLESHESLKKEIDNEVYTSLRNLRGVKLAEAAISFDLHLGPERLYESVKDGVPLIAKRDGLSPAEKEVIGLKLELNFAKDELANAQQELAEANKYIAAANQEVAELKAERRTLLEKQKKLQALLCRQRQRRAPTTSANTPAVQVSPRLRKFMSSSQFKAPSFNEDIKIALPPTNILPCAVHAATPAYDVGPVTKTDSISSHSLSHVSNGHTSHGGVRLHSPAIHGLSHELFIANQHGSGAALRNPIAAVTSKGVTWNAGHNTAVPFLKSSGSHQSPGAIQTAPPTPMGNASSSQPNVIIPVALPNEATSSGLAAPFNVSATSFISAPAASSATSDGALKIPETTVDKKSDNFTRHRASTHSKKKTPLQPIISDRFNSQQTPTTDTPGDPVPQCHPLPPKPAATTLAEPTHGHSEIGHLESTNHPEPYRPHNSNSAIGAIHKHLESGSVAKSRSSRGRGKGKGGRRTKSSAFSLAHEARDVVKTDV